MSLDRPSLPATASEKLSILEGPEILGATRQLGIAAELFGSLARSYEGEPEDLIQSTRWVANRLVALRGESSQAITNGLSLMLEGLDDQHGRPLEQVRAWIIERVSAYDAHAQRWMHALVESGANLLRDASRVLVYDFSSSVAAVLGAADYHGRNMTVIVPEARSLDGGIKYLRDLEKSSLYFEFIPDVGVAAAIQHCDLALVGAETLSAEGGCFNTVGTLGVALAANYWRVPFFVASTLIKIDTRTLHGFRRPIPSVDFRRKLLPHLAETHSIHVMCPDLDYTPPALIEALITEIGVIPPVIACQQALRYSDPKEGKH